jgi:hypothetical protein
VPVGAYGDLVERTLSSLLPQLCLEIKAITRHAGHTTDSLTPVVKQLADYDERRKVLLARRKELENQTDEASIRALKRLEKLDTLGDVDFDAVFLPQGGPVLRALAPLLPFYDIDPRKVRVLGTVAWDNPVIATEPALYGGWFAAPPPASRQVFETEYKKAFGVKPVRVASLAYDATALAAVIAKRSANRQNTVVIGGTGQNTTPGFAPAAGRRIYSAAALTTANGFAGIDGIFRLLPSGLVERGLAVVEVRPRRFKVVSPAPKSFRALTN